MGLKLTRNLIKQPSIRSSFNILKFINILYKNYINTNKFIKDMVQKFQEFGNSLLISSDF